MAQHVFVHVACLGLLVTTAAALPAALQFRQAEVITEEGAQPSSAPPSSQMFDGGVQAGSEWVVMPTDTGIGSISSIQLEPTGDGYSDSDVLIMDSADQPANFDPESDVVFMSDTNSTISTDGDGNFSSQVDAIGGQNFEAGYGANEPSGGLLDQGFSADSNDVSVIQPFDVPAAGNDDGFSSGTSTPLVNPLGRRCRGTAKFDVSIEIDLPEEVNGEAVQLRDIMFLSHSDVGVLSSPTIVASPAIFKMPSMAGSDINDEVYKTLMASFTGNPDLLETVVELKENFTHLSAQPGNQQSSDWRAGIFDVNMCNEDTGLWFSNVTLNWYLYEGYGQPIVNEGETFVVAGGISTENGTFEVESGGATGSTPEAEPLSQTENMSFQDSVTVVETATVATPDAARDGGQQAEVSRRRRQAGQSVQDSGVEVFSVTNGVSSVIASNLPSGLVLDSEIEYVDGEEADALFSDFVDGGVPLQTIDPIQVSQTDTATPAVSGLDVVSEPANAFPNQDQADIGDQDQQFTVFGGSTLEGVPGGPLGAESELIDLVELQSMGAVTFADLGESLKTILVPADSPINDALGQRPDVRLLGKVEMYLAETCMTYRLPKTRGQAAATPTSMLSAGGTLGNDPFGMLDATLLPQDLNGSGQQFGDFTETGPVELSGTPISEPDQVVSGLGDVISGQGEVVAGQNEVVAGQNEVVAGQNEVVAGQNEVVAGQNEVVAGQNEVVAGQNEVVAGQGEVVAGEEVSPGQDQVLAGQGEDTTEVVLDANSQPSSGLPGEQKALVSGMADSQSELTQPQALSAKSLPANGQADSGVTLPVLEMGKSTDQGRSSNTAVQSSVLVDPFASEDLPGIAGVPVLPAQLEMR